MVQSHVKVYVRLRPTGSPHEGLRVGPEGQELTIHLPKNVDAGLINNQLENLAFKYDGILENVSQESVYNATAHEVVDSLLAGYSGTLFCYGQTGAGKTFTMSGDLRNYNQRGVIPRALHHVFREIDMRVDKIFKVWVSYLEIYNEQMYDLLAENPGTCDNLAVLEDSSNNTYIRGLTRIPVQSEEEALAQFFVGDQSRATSSHILNSNSSRSHAIFTVYLEMRTSAEANERAILSKLHLVDLAGSERTKKTNVTGQTLKEANFINKSLSFLEQTVNCLSKKESYVPFRQTKLTSVLRDALGGNCKTVMIANVWSEAAHVDETISTLRFAARVRTLVTNVNMTESADLGLLVKRYERQIKELKTELAMRDALSGRSRVSYDDLTDVQLRDMGILAKSFLQGNADLEALPVDTVKLIRETYRAMRNSHQALVSELSAAVQAVRNSAGAAASPSTAEPFEVADGSLVGDVPRDRATFQVGTAPTDARPRSQPTASGLLADPHMLSSTPPGSSPPTPMTDRRKLVTTSMEGLGATSPPNKSDPNQLFVRFKREIPSGISLTEALKGHQQEVRANKVRVKELAAAVNGAKHRMDGIQAQITEATARVTAAASKSGVLDAEQAKLVTDLKAEKARYRSDFDALRDARESLQVSLVSEAESRNALISAFQEWCAQLGPGAYKGTYDDDEDVLDSAEAFDKMNMEKIMSFDPDSVAYYAAKKTATSSPPKPTVTRKR